MADYKIIQGSALEVLRTMGDDSVNCIVTSPPYYGLRSYGTTPQVWNNGNSMCEGEHRWEEHKQRAKGGKNLPDNMPNTGNDTYTQQDSSNPRFGVVSSFCSVCGAWRGELGLEPTPSLYIDHLTQIFSESRRVLTDDGTLWVNIADSYAGSNGGKGDYRENKGLQKDIYNFDKPQSRFSKWRSDTTDSIQVSHDIQRDFGTKPKDLLMIPARLAISLRDDGWYLRSEIIWHKPNPMPESVTDRPTKSHEMIYLLSKSRSYYYDADSIAEKALTEWDDESFIPDSDKDSLGIVTAATGASRNRTFGKKHETRNKRDVWTITTKPYKEAHFATFPPDIPETCILAGCPVGGVVLDPFCGSGTSGYVSLKHKRNFVGIELNPDYIELARKRIESVQEALL